MSKPARHHKLDNLRNLVDGSEEAVNQMVNVFRESTPEIVDELNTQFKEGNWDQYAKTAHKLKSSIDLFQIEELAKSVRELEELAKAEAGADKIKPLHDRLNQVIEEVLDDMA